MARRLAFALVLAALTAPAQALAASTSPYRGLNSIDVPALTGEHVLFAEYLSGRARVSSVPLSGGTRTQLAEAQAPSRDGSVAFSYAGTDAHVYVGRYIDPGPAAMLGGPPTGPLATVENCATGRDYDFRAPGPAVDGDVAVWAGAACRRQQIHIQSGDASRVIDAGDFVYAVAAGGGYVAWLRMVSPPDPSTPIGTRLVVTDAATGLLRYSADVPAATTLAVEPDGTAVISTFAPGGTPPAHPCPGPSARFLWYTPADPVAHEVPGVSSCDGAFRVAGGRLAYVAYLGNERRMLTLTDLGGATSQPVARLDAFPPIVAFDFDGRHVAWSQTGCRDYSLRIRDAADASPPDAALGCPVQVGAPRLARDRTVHVPIACPRGCRSVGTAGMTFVSPRWLHVWRQTRTGTRYAPYVRIDVKPGGRATLRLPTTAYQRAVIRRKRRVSVRLKIVAQDIYLPRIARTLRSA